MMRYFVFILILSTLSIYAFAQSAGARPNAPKEGIIRGVIIDNSDNTPLQYTSVALFREKDSTLVTGSITNQDGSFVLNDIGFGRYYLEANYMGYDKKQVSDIVISGNKKVIDVGTINLAEASTSLGEVEIVADQAHVEYKLDRKIVNVSEDINAASGTAADVLQNTPSVNVDIEGNVSIRGSSNFQVLIDGKPSPLSGPEALQQIPASAIKNIEIITNPSAKYDPDGMAGIINIVSKKHMLQGLSGIFNASIGTGDKYSGDFLLSYRTEKINVFGGANFRDDTYRGGFYSFSEINQNDSVTRFTLRDGERKRTRNSYEVKGGIDFYLNDKNTLSFSAEYGYRNSGEYGLQRTRYWDDPLTFNDYTINDNSGSRGGDYNNLNLNYQRIFNDEGHKLDAFINYSWDVSDDIEGQMEYLANENFDFNTGDLLNRTRAIEIGEEDEIRAQIDYTLPINENSRLEAGYQARIDFEYETFEFRESDNVSDELLVNPLYTNSTDFYRNIQAVYGTYSNKLGKYEYLLGLRGELTDRRIQTLQVDDPATIYRFDYFPTVHLSRQFKNDHQVMISYSKRINRPSGWYLEPFETYIDAHSRRRGDPNLKPEYMNSAELGYQKTFGKSFISFEAYYKNTIDKIDRIIILADVENAIYLYTFGNIAEDHSLGGELMLNYSQLKWLELNGSTSLYRYRMNGSFENQEIDRSSNNWDARLNATFNFSTLTRLQIQTFYNGPSVSVQGERDGFFFSNIAIRHDFFDRKLSATLQVRDLFGTMKYEFRSFGENFNTNMRFTREPRVVQLSLSYKLNNFKNRDQDRSGNGMEPGGVEGDF